MNKISMTSFLSILSATGTAKTKKVADAKYRKPYSPASDYYKGIRESIVKIVYNDSHLDELEEVINRAHPSKTAHFKEVAQGFKKWWRQHEIECLEPPKGVFGKRDLAINVNPEISAVVDGIPRIVKLFFYKEKVTKNQQIVSSYLMKSCFAEDFGVNMDFSVFDVRRARILKPKGDSPQVAALVDGELMCIENIWKSV